MFDKRACSDAARFLGAVVSGVSDFKVAISYHAKIPPFKRLVR